MKTIRSTALLAACLLAGTAWAQNAGKPLNLKLPPAGSYPAASGSAAGTGTTNTQAAPAAGNAAPAGAASTAAASNAQAGRAATAANASSYRADPPGTYYGDTSGRMGSDETARAVPACDDATYNQPQMHGSVGMGVMSGNHVSGNYQTGTVSLSQAFGSCEHPTGGVSISVGGATGHFHGH
ncbi:hypothetical protein [Fulvimonas soli]|jgi:hypothetical protein|uniref:Uncharacterized protein n=1 Tax=Fulvimonas soli TaxID=155197 RepID=A0A316IH37_9GAMM|nr:hypothetical protein [Fulvimonas soli]PWK91986.1 hypothetical protein C7456_103105 [Fulvimonas soli]TNY27401.1 hypothetical protein BV497_03670 [Fulvimonas soli]